jgi:hypothetical protein
MITEINEAIKTQSHLQLDVIPEERAKRTPRPTDAKPKVKKPKEMTREVRTTGTSYGRSAAKVMSAKHSKKVLNRSRRSKG